MSTYPWIRATQRKSIFCFVCSSIAASSYLSISRLFVGQGRASVVCYCSDVAQPTISKDEQAFPSDTDRSDSDTNRGGDSVGPTMESKSASTAKPVSGEALSIWNGIAHVGESLQLSSLSDGGFTSTQPSSWKIISTDFLPPRSSNKLTAFWEKVGTKGNESEGGKKQQLEILELTSAYDPFFLSSTTGTRLPNSVLPPPLRFATGSKENSGSKNVPVLRIISFLPGVDPIRVKEALCDTKRRLHWDKNYSDFEILHKFDLPTSTNSVDGPPAFTGSSSGLLNVFRRSLQFSLGAVGKGASLLHVVPGVPEDRVIAYHRVAPSLLSALKLPSRLFLYERLTTAYRLHTSTKESEQCSPSLSSPSPSVAYSILYRSVSPTAYHHQDEQDSLMAGRCTPTSDERIITDSSLCPSYSSLTQRVAPPKKGSDSDMQVFMHYQEILLLPVYDHRSSSSTLTHPSTHKTHTAINATTSSFAEDFSSVVHALRSSIGTTVEKHTQTIFPSSWFLPTPMQLGLNLSHAARSVAMQSMKMVPPTAGATENCSLPEPIGTLMVMTGINDVKPPRALPKFVQDQAAKYMTAQAYQKLLDSVLSSSSSPNKK